MRAILVVGLVVASASAYMKVPESYHDKIGIPEAVRIKAYEVIIIANQTKTVTALDRVVGGSAAPLNAHPYLGGLVISLVNLAYDSVCGSSLISSNRLLTAAHCWFDGVRQAWQFVVVLGSQYLFQGGTRIATTNVVTHPQYIPSMLINDIAVIYLPTRVTFSDSIQPISLPSSYELSETFVNEWAIAAGYGRTSDHQVSIPANTLVSQVNLLVISESECKTVYESSIKPSHLCASGRGGVGVCGGDSGGPLVLNRNGRKILIGVISFGPQFEGMTSCQRGLPSGFTRVTSFDNFIKQHL